jgi:hypothetical protein
MSRRVSNPIASSQFPNHIPESTRRGCQVVVTGVGQAEPWIRGRPAAQHLDQSTLGKRFSCAPSIYVRKFDALQRSAQNQAIAVER